MITQLRLTNFKNFKDATALFGPVSLLIGANATGKSNVREAFRFLHGIARGYTLADIIGEKYGEGGQPLWSGIRGGAREICRMQEAEFEAEATIETPGSRAGSRVSYQYAIRVQCSANGSPPRVTSERLYKMHRLIRHGPTRLVPTSQGHLSFMPIRNTDPIFDSHPQDDPLAQRTGSQIRVRLSRGGSHRAHGPVLEGLSGQPILTQVRELAEAKKVLNKVKAQVTAVLEELESMRFMDLAPEWMRKPSVPGQHVLGDRGENLSSVLQAICEDPQAKAALTNWLRELTPMDVTDLEFPQDVSGRILVHLVEEGRRKISALSASDGTLRFLAILAALLGPKPARLYFMEEIDTGIHPARLALLMQLLASQTKAGRTQVIATTHSPQVLRYIDEKDLRSVTLAYRLRGTVEGRLKPLSEIPHLLDALKKSDLTRLHESAWMENTMEFTEGTPTPFPIEDLPEPP